MTPTARPKTQSLRGGDVVSFFSLVAAVLLLLLNLTSRQVYENSDLQPVSILALGTLGLSLFIVMSQSQKHVWSFASMLLLLIGLFHLGLLGGPLLGRPLAELSDSSTAWMDTIETRQAFWYVVNCVVCYTIGASVLRIVAGRESTREKIEPDTFGPVAAKVGGLLLAVSVVSWFVIVAILLGRDAFTRSYIEFFETTNSSSITFANLGISLGLVLVCVNPSARLAKIGITAFVVFAAASLSIGARSTVMFPAAAAAVVLAYGRRMPRPRWMPFIVLGVATLTGVIRSVRPASGSSISVSQLVQAPLYGLSELGYTIRVVQTSILWHDTYEEPLRGGDTYVAWLSRIADSLFGEPAPEPDFRLMNVEISQRIGGLGGSIVAESHHNFGIVGGLVLIFLLGVSAAWISRVPRTTFGVAVVGVMATPLFLHVRNSFAPVIFSLLCGFVILALCRLLVDRSST